MNPLFSVILTTYNRSHLLSRAIRSVLQQTFTDFELIIVDDHSSDNTPQAIAEFSDTRIIYIRQPENLGVSTARNTGIQQAKGEYICFLDDDDEYLPDFLKEINHFLERIKEPFIGFIRVGIVNIYTPNNIINAKERIETKLWHFEQEKNLLFLSNMPYTGLVYHHLCFKQVGLFNEKFNFAEDLDLVFRILAANMRYASIPKALLKIHIHEHASLSRSVDLAYRATNLERFLHDHDKFLNQHLPLWLCWNTSLVGDYYHTGKKQQARKLIWRICKKKWFSPKIWELFLRFELLKPLKSTLRKLFTPTK